MRRDITLIYESGTIGTQPTVLPLSIGDGELCDTRADDGLRAGDLPVLAAGRPHLGRVSERRASRPLRQSQLDGDRQLRRSRRCGCPAPAARRRSRRAAREVFIIMRQSPRSFVSRLDFMTTLGHGDGRGHRRRLGIRRPRPDEGDHRPVRDGAGRRDQRADGDEPASRRDTRAGAREHTGWHVAFASEVGETPPPTP